MAFRIRTAAILVPLLIGPVTTGCRDSAPPSPVVTLEEAPGGMKSAFAEAPAPIKAAAEAAADGIAAGEYAGSLGRIQELSGNPELSAEQRQALAASQQALMVKLAEAAEAGDKQAAELMETHRARK